MISDFPNDRWRLHDAAKLKRILIERERLKAALERCRLFALALAADGPFKSTAWQEYDKALAWERSIAQALTSAEETEHMTFDRAFGSYGVVSIVPKTQAEKVASCLSHEFIRLQEISNKLFAAGHHIGPNNVCSALSALVQSGVVERAGERYKYAYRLKAA